MHTHARRSGETVTAFTGTVQTLRMLSRRFVEQARVAENAATAVEWRCIKLVSASACLVRSAQLPASPSQTLAEPDNFCGQHLAVRGNWRNVFQCFKPSQHFEFRPVEFEPAEIESTRINVKSKPVEIESGSVDIESGSVDVESGSVDVESGSVEFDLEEAIHSITDTIARGGEYARKYHLYNLQYKSKKKERNNFFKGFVAIVQDSALVYQALDLPVEKKAADLLFLVPRIVQFLQAEDSCREQILKAAYRESKETGKVGAVTRFAPKSKKKGFRSKTSVSGKFSK